MVDGMNTASFISSNPNGVEDEEPAKLPLYLSLLAIILLPAGLGLLPPLHEEETSSASDESTVVFETVDISFFGGVTVDTSDFVFKMF